MGGREEKSFRAAQLQITPRRCGEETPHPWQPPVAGGHPGRLAQVLVQPQSSGNVRNFWGWLSSSAGTPGTCGGSLGAPLKRSWWSSEREGWG